MTREEAVKFLNHIADEAQAELESNRRVWTNQKRLEALSMAISALMEQPSPCAACGYGGKHLDAPPCTDCPAYPKRTRGHDA